VPRRGRPAAGGLAVTQKSRGRRQGEVFSMRIAPAVRAELDALCAADSGPKRLGPWLVWRALGTAVPGLALPELEAESRDRRGNTASMNRRPCTTRGELVAGFAVLATSDGPSEPLRNLRIPLASSAPPAPVVIESTERAIELYGAGSEAAAATARVLGPPIADRLILDLCAGSGAWSEPYQRAGYRVRRVTLPADDVRTFIPPEGVWGILAAPPCTEFSLAKNGRERDFARGLETVAACHRIIMTARPRWWALENPVGLLSRWLGRPPFVFQPHDFGDPWTKRTAIWGEFRAPVAGPHVRPSSGGGPICERCSPDAPGPCNVADHRAITPPGFARAFFEANP
jgi:hypothetical protein